MNKIVFKKQLSEQVFRMRFEAPLIARERQAGQFVILQVSNDWGERIPLTIADADAAKGTVDIIFQVVGETTLKLSKLKEGDFIPTVVGPLGRPTDIRKVDWAVVVGGGIGVAPSYPIVQAFKKAGAKVTVIMGARNKDLLIMEEEMRAAADELIVITDDGSYGRKGLVTEPLKECCERSPKPDEVVVIGPPIMMKFAALATKPYGVKTIASLNTIMIDGTGMCGGCRVSVGGETKFVCVDGPEFDAHQVDFDNMMKRLGTYRKQEEEHRCRHGWFPQPRPAQAK